MMYSLKCRTEGRSAPAHIMYMALYSSAFISPPFLSLMWLIWMSRFSGLFSQNVVSVVVVSFIILRVVAMPV